MTPRTKQQATIFVETLFEIRRPKDTSLSARMRYQRWLLRETAQFWPNETMVDIVSEVVAPTMNQRYPH